MPTPDATSGERPSFRTAGEVFSAELSRLVSLNELSSSLVGAQNPTEVGRAVMRHGLDLVGACAGALVMLDSDGFLTVANHKISVAATDRWDRFDIDAGNEPFADAITRGDPLFFENRAALLEAYPALTDEVTEHTDHHAWVVLPLRVGDRTSGALGLIFGEPREFDQPSRLIMSTLAHLAAQAAARTQLLDEQQRALHSIEEALEPRIDPIPGIEVSHLYRPATVAAAAGGDWYDIVNIDERSSMIAIGDVANHGVVAIGEMSRARFVLHAFASAGFGPAEIAHRTDQLFAKLASTYATGVIAELDHRTMTLTWTTAGHPFPILVRADGTVTVLGATHGAPLGTGFTEQYGSQELHLVDGDKLVLYTDGLIEQPVGDLAAATQRLCEALQGHAGIDGFAADLFARLRPDGRHHDDVAVLVLGVGENAGHTDL